MNTTRKVAFDLMEGLIGLLITGTLTYLSIRNGINTFVIILCGISAMYYTFSTIVNICGIVYGLWVINKYMK